MFKRILTLIVVATLVTTAFAAPVSSAPPRGAFDGPFNGPTLDGAGITSASYGEDIISYGGDPGWYVYVEDGEMDSLRTWADADGRELIDVDEEANRALVSAPPADIGVSLLDRTLGSGLGARDYVNYVAVAQRTTYAEPMYSLDGNESYEPPTGYRVASVLSASATMGDFSADGQAWSEDAEEKNLSSVRSALGVDNVSETGDGVRVAVIDTGLNAQATSDPLYQNRTTAAKNTITNETGIEAVADGNGHGSWVAGAIAADPDPNTDGEEHEGIAPDATVIPIKVLSDEGGGSTQDIVEGIEHANENNADIISMSLGSQVYNPVIADEIESFLEDGGTAVIVAAGNSKTNPATRYISSPADADGVVAVGATNTSEADEARPAYFSEVGPDNGVTDASNGVTNGEGPDVAAPGMNISAPVYQNGIRRNETLSGTSMATPMVSGVAALMLDANPSLEGHDEEFRTALLDAAEPAPHAGVTEVGHGLVNAEHAVALTTPDEEQADVLTDKAEARDAANRAYSGSRPVRFISRFGGDS